MTGKTVLKGGCLCGAVRYEVDGRVRHITHCHCSMCRKAHGAAFATYGLIQRIRLHFLQGEEILLRYRSSPDVQRSSCGVCSSPMFWQRMSQPEYIDIALGTLDDDPGGRAMAHIWVASKACWFEITDPLPQHPETLPRVGG